MPFTHHTTFTYRSQEPDTGFRTDDAEASKGHPGAQHSGRSSGVRAVRTGSWGEVRAPACGIEVVSCRQWELAVGLKW